MRASTWAAAVLVGALGAGCGGSDESGPTGPDVFTVTTSGSTVTFTDDVQDVSVAAWLLVGGGHKAELVAPSVYLAVSVPGQSPGALTGSISYILGGLSYSNGAAPISVTRLEPAFLGIFEGSFDNVTLRGSGLPDIVVSGSFRATRLN